MRRKRQGGLFKGVDKSNSYDKINIENNINNYRIISIHNKTKKVMTIDTTNNLESAKLIADKVADNNDVKCYVHTDSNRVLYIAKE